MKSFSIGVISESFRLPFDEALDAAVKLGANGIQMYAVPGDHTPEALSPAGRKELLMKLKDRGLVFSALCGDLGRGFGHTELNPELIERSKRILDLAKDLETDIVTTHIGVVPEDPNHDRYKIMSDACFELSAYADSIGSHFAIETGPETSAVLKRFLDQLHSTGVAVNLDPANLVMVTGDDPVQAVYNLKDYIVHTHAKDGVMLQKGNPEWIYRVIQAPEDVAGIQFFREVPLGTGSVDFPAYLKALQDIGYNGYLTIEREVGANPAADIATAADFLRNTIAQL